MKEQQQRIESKWGEQFLATAYTKETMPQDVLTELTIAYCASFWSGTWEELLVSADGRNLGSLNPETLQIMIKNGIDIQNKNWTLDAWQRANACNLVDLSGMPLRPFWTFDEGKKTVEKFMSSQSEGGFGGRCAVLTDPKDSTTAGFTAFAVGDSSLADMRFPYSQLQINGRVEDLSLSQVLEQQFGDARYGIFLDFAIACPYQNSSIGSALFDYRLQELIALGADVIVGRTIATSPAQYIGNYKKRGLTEIAFDPKNPDKALFASPISAIIPRI